MEKISVSCTCEIATGAGGFRDSADILVTSIVVETDRRGIAGVRFVFDQSTSIVPYYTQLNSGDTYATRVGANLIRVTTAPVSLSQDIWAFSAPGPLHEADVSNAQWSHVPEMLGGRAQVVARDALGNPIANAEASVRILSGGGALLTEDEFNTFVLAQGGTVLLLTVPGVRIMRIW